LTPDLEAHVEDLAEQIAAIIAPGQPLPQPSTLPGRPLAAEMRKVRSRLRSPSIFRRIRSHPRLFGTGALLLFAGVWWAQRPRPVRDTVFVVREVSSGGGNESTVRLTAKGLRFFEGPDETASIEQRKYTREFGTDVTRFIKVEIELGYDPPGRVVRFPFACVLEREGAQVLTTIALTATVQPGWSESYHVAGWGNRSAGSWEPGRYRAECRYGDRLVARDWFTVRPGGHIPPGDAPSAEAEPLASLGAKVAAIRLFESGFGDTDRSERIYADTFAAGESRYINLEVTLAFDAPTSPIEAEITCRYLRNRVEEIARTTLVYRIPPGERQRWAASGWGARSPGYWQPGEYLVACDDGAATLGQAGFTIR
jgi:hypothetical protein